VNDWNDEACTPGELSGGGEQAVNNTAETAKVGNKTRRDDMYRSCRESHRSCIHPRARGHTYRTGHKMSAAHPGDEPAGGADQDWGKRQEWNTTEIPAWGAPLPPNWDRREEPAGDTPTTKPAPGTGSEPAPWTGSEPGGRDAGTGTSPGTHAATPRPSSPPPEPAPQLHPNPLGRQHRRVSERRRLSEDRRAVREQRQSGRRRSGFGAFAALVILSFVAVHLNTSREASYIPEPDVVRYEPADPVPTTDMSADDPTGSTDDGLADIVVFGEPYGNLLWYSPQERVEDRDVVTVLVEGRNPETTPLYRMFVKVELFDGGEVVGYGYSMFDHIAPGATSVTAVAVTLYDPGFTNREFTITLSQEQPVRLTSDEQDRLGRTTSSVRNVELDGSTLIVDADARLFGFDFAEAVAVSYRPDRSVAGAVSDLVGFTSEQSRFEIVIPETMLAAFEDPDNTITVYVNHWAV
jgi:hypothetical protein